MSGSQIQKHPTLNGNTLNHIASFAELATRGNMRVAGIRIDKTRTEKLAIELCHKIQKLQIKKDEPYYYIDDIGPLAVNDQKISSIRFSVHPEPLMPFQEPEDTRNFFSRMNPFSRPAYPPRYPRILKVHWTKTVQNAEKSFTVIIKQGYIFLEDDDWGSITDWDTITFDELFTMVLVGKCCILHMLNHQNYNKKKQDIGLLLQAFEKLKSTLSGIQEKLERKVYIDNSDNNFQAWYNTQINNHIQWNEFNDGDRASVHKYTSKFHDMIEKHFNIIYGGLLLQDVLHQNIYINLDYIKDDSFPYSIYIKWNFEEGGESIVSRSIRSHNIRFHYDIDWTDRLHRPDKLIEDINKRRYVLYVGCEPFPGKGTIPLEEIQQVVRVGRQILCADLTRYTRSLGTSDNETKNKMDSHFRRFMTDMSVAMSLIESGQVAQKYVAIAQKAGKQTTFHRPSPSPPAKQYKDKCKRGNDGNMYISKKDKNGVYRWYKRRPKKQP